MEDDALGNQRYWAQSGGASGSPWNHNHRDWIERAKVFADSFKSQFAPNLPDPDFAGIFAKVEDEVDKEYLPIAPFSERRFCNITSDGFFSQRDALTNVLWRLEEPRRTLWFC